MAILIIVGVVVAVLLVGGLLAFVFSRADRVVTDTKEDIVAEERSYNPGLTMGHEIKVDADYATQMKEARLQAAAMAAALPRGANSTIGRYGIADIPTASEGLDKDPMTAVRIATFHGWDGARNGIPAGGAPATVAAPAAGAAAPAADGPVELVPGKDYPYIEITDGMPPEEARKARIANAKARSAAMKAAKEAQNAAGGAPVAAAAAPAAATQATAAPAAAGVAPPDLIEITDDMSPEEVRKARIANAKAQSAYNKALKAAGASAAVAAAAPQPEAAPASAPAAAAPAAAGIAPPDLIEITDDMSPDEIRKARIANAKAQSAYNKALKAAGIDPASTTAAAAPAATAPAAAATASATRAPAPAVETIDSYVNSLEGEDLSKFQANIEYIEDVTEAYASKLRAAGIDSPLELLRRGATPSGRKEIAKATGLDEAMILTWVNQCDLYRIKGVGREYADLLEEAGVDTVVELAQRNAANLTAKLVEVNTAKSLVQKLPTEKSVGNWVEQAKELPRAVFYSDSDAPAEAKLAAATTPAPSSPSVAVDSAAAAGIAPPTLIEITDDMSPDEIRSARISNAKATSAYNKALKAAGIDPASLR